MQLLSDPKRKKIYCGNILVIGVDCIGVHDALQKVVQEARPYLQTVKQSIRLTGGCIKLPGITDLLPQSHRSHVDSTWIGGSILASLSTYLPYLTTHKHQYDEHGSNLFYRT